MIILLVAEGGEQEEVCLQSSEALHHAPPGAFCSCWDCSYCYAACSRVFVREGRKEVILCVCMCVYVSSFGGVRIYVYATCPITLCPNVCVRACDIVQSAA